MTEENNFVIRSKLDFDTSDKSNKAFLRLYKDRRRGIINRLQQISTFIEVIKKLEKKQSFSRGCSSDTSPALAKKKEAQKITADGTYGP